MKYNQIGRSMIEMLGVLAIIAVLSVGGIAGYSKAMEKYKSNKLIEEYSYLIYGLLEHLNDLKYLSSDNTMVPVYDYVQAANLVPQTWIINDEGWKSLKDGQNNLIDIFSRNNRLVINFYIGGVSKKDTFFSPAFSSKLCVSIFQNLGQPLHSVVFAVRTSAWGTGRSIWFYGDSYCNEKIKCVALASLEEIHEACKICESSNAYCNISLEF